jgi:hypothetical protein
MSSKSAIFFGTDECINLSGEETTLTYKIDNCTK